MPPPSPQSQLTFVMELDGKTAPLELATMLHGCTKVVDGGHCNEALNCAGGGGVGTVDGVTLIVALAATVPDEETFAV